MAGQAQQGQADNSLGFLWIIIAVFAIGLLIWYLYHDVLVAFYLHIKVYELEFLSLFTTSFDNLKETLKVVITNNPGAVTFTQLITISDQVGSGLRIPVVIILVSFAIILYTTSAKSRHRTIFDMQKLLEQEKENWPQVTPISKLNLVEEDIDEGKWAMAMTPMQFAKKYKLIKEEFKEASEGQLKKRGKIEAKIIRSKANALFSRQMGRPWTNANDLSIHARALFAVFAAKAVGDRDSASNLLRQIASSAGSGGKLDFSGANELLKKHIDHKLVKNVVERHAFELTVLASMINVARTDGVLATAEFLWLKPLDRSLWYMLNAVGRQTAPVEVAGPFAHWLAEKEIGRKLTVPMLEEATIALENALADIIYVPDEED